MLMEEFQKWRRNPNNNSSLGDENSEDNFSIFFQHYGVGKGGWEMMCLLAYQIYELQVCVEGIIEDMEK